MTLDQDLHRISILQSLAQDRLGRDVAVAARDPRDRQPGLMPVEEAAMTRAVPARQREFACGRAAARQALARIGIHGQPIPHGDDRAPVWPAGTTGSITHTATCCIAAVARTERVQSLGLDLEGAGPLDDDLWDSVLTASELEWLVTQPKPRRGQLAKVIFAAKECAYKCQYPLTRTVFGFDAMTVELDQPRKQFHAYCSLASVRRIAENRMTGSYVIAAGHVLATMVLPRWGGA